MRPRHLIRSQTPRDAHAVRDLLTLAFPTDAEARLVETLAAANHLCLALVAERPAAGTIAGTTTGHIAGYIAFSPVTLDGQPTDGVGLAPLAVHPDDRRTGLGTALINTGLERCAENGATFAVVLGDPNYYSRFGFEPASRAGLDSIYQAGDAFMARELTPGGIPRPGLIRYAPAFDDLE